MSLPRRIRKYRNRKLYDEHESKYLSMLGLSDLIRSGVHVEVIDDSNEQDITFETMSRALYERTKWYLHRRPADRFHEPFSRSKFESLIKQIG